MAQGRHRNNFDLLRILAATQVAIIHAITLLKIPYNGFSNLLTLFPGVPIFFVISGFLVAESLERNELRTFFVARALRIYPALWACLIVSIIFAGVSGVSFPPSEFWPWLVAQVTFVQFYNPDFLRHFGVGVLNGSLWTIPVELQFYLTLPLLALLRTRALLLVAAASVIFNQLFIWLAGDLASNAAKLVANTLPPYLYMFLIGTLLQRHRDIVRRFLADRVIAWLAIYVVLELVLSFAPLHIGGNYINPLSATMLALVVVSAAHSQPFIRLPGDISYGLYLYHVPLLNLFIAHGYYKLTAGWAAVAAIACAAMLASLSWVLVERPALMLKQVRLARRQSSAAT